jgi:hypothetical protein
MLPTSAQKALLVVVMWQRRMREEVRAILSKVMVSMTHRTHWAPPLQDSTPSLEALPMDQALNYNESLDESPIQTIARRGEKCKKVTEPA